MGRNAAPGSGERRLSEARAALVRAASTAADVAALPRRYSDIADSYLAGLLGDASGGEGEGLALVAVGGYGRSELFPGSDLDVVLVHRQRRDAGEVARRVWYRVWDDGTRLDNSVRTVREAIAVARDDLPAALGLLDARLVAGDPDLAGELARRAVELVQARARHFLGDLAASVSARHEAKGQLAFLLEPDLKESHGGLRDVQALRAAAVALPALAPALGTASLAEPHAVVASVRTALHVRTGRAGDRLLLEVQDEVAALLGFADADLLVAALADAGRQIAWLSDDGWRRVRSWLAGPRGRVVPRDRPLAPGLVLRDGEIVPEPGEAGGPGDFGVLLRAAAISAQEGLPLASSLPDRLVAGALPLAEPWPEDVRQSFLTVLGAREHAVAVLETLDRSRVLERLLPEWQAVRNRPQRNAYHRHTVDRHLLETVARAGYLTRTVARPDILLVAALLHDVGKGSAGDHSLAGAEIASSVATRMGFATEDVEVLATLVEHHLLLADTATRRDLDDPATIAAVAKVAGDRSTLELLHALARADGEATGPAAWGAWKATLVAELVVRVDRALSAGAAGGAGAAAPTPLDVPAELEAALVGGEMAVAVSAQATHSVVTVVAPDRPGLLAVVAGVLALHGLGVRSALISSRGAMAIERFQVEPAFGRQPDAGLLRADLEAALAGALPLEARLGELARAYDGSRRRTSALPGDVVVGIDNSASDRATLVEVRAPDGRGLLSLVARVISSHGLDVTSAHVSTLGHEVVDTFYVTVAGRVQADKLLERERIESLRAQLVASIGNAEYKTTR